VARGAARVLRHGDRVKLGEGGDGSAGQLLPEYEFRFASVRGGGGGAGGGGDGAAMAAGPPLPDAACAQAMCDALDAEADEASMPAVAHRASASAHDEAGGGARPAAANQAKATQSQPSQGCVRAAKRKRGDTHSDGSGSGGASSAAAVEESL